MRTAANCKMSDVILAYEKHLDLLGSRYDMFKNSKIHESDVSKVDFDMENINDQSILCDNDGLGPQSVYCKGGWLNFIGIRCGGDWEFPVYIIFYLDKNMKPRFFVPKYGNAYNYDTKSAFGDDEDKDYDFLLKWSKENCKNMYDSLGYSGYREMSYYYETLFDLNKIEMSIKKRFTVG